MFFKIFDICLRCLTRNLTYCYTLWSCFYPLLFYIYVKKLKGHKPGPENIYTILQQYLGWRISLLVDINMFFVTYIYIYMCTISEISFFKVKRRGKCFLSKFVAFVDDAAPAAAIMNKWICLYRVAKYIQVTKSMCIYNKYTSSRHIHLQKYIQELYLFKKHTSSRIIYLQYI